MSFIQIILAVYLVIRLFKKFIDGYTEKDSPTPPTPKLAKPRKVPKYNYCNDRLVEGHLGAHYINELGIKDKAVIDSEFDLEIVDYYYYQIVQEMENAKEQGLRLHYNVHDLITAKAYLTDRCRFLGNGN